MVGEPKVFPAKMAIWIVFGVALLAVAHVAASPIVVAPRLPDSPFPVSHQPSSIIVYNLTDASFDLRLMVLSAVGIVAQRCPELATVDSADKPAGGPTGRGGSSLSAWHLSLLPTLLRYDMQHSIIDVIKHFAADFKGYILSESASGSGGPGSDNGSMHVAVSLAGVLRALVVTPSTIAIAEKAGLQMLMDARKTTLEETFKRFGANFSTKLLFNQQHANLQHTTDLAVYGSAFALYDATLTMPLAQAALERLDQISMVLGWASEVDFVTSASRHGHQVLCSDFTTNIPVFSNFAPPDLPHLPQHASCRAASDDTRHTVTFMFTDGDSATWDLGTFSSSAFDWWASPNRSQFPLAWTFQPMLHELHPFFLKWVLDTASSNDELLVGPSGAGYTYLDRYPSSGARARFTSWTAANIARSGLLNMINQIQVGVFNGSLEAELLASAAPPVAIFVDEEVELSIKGDAWRLLNATGAESDTIVTSRRHCLSKTFGDVTPTSLIGILNDAPREPLSPSGYSVIGVEVWGYGVRDIAEVVARLNTSHVRIVGVGEYVACLKERALPRVVRYI